MVDAEDTQVIKTLFIGGGIVEIIEGFIETALDIIPGSFILVWF